jgi:hypothetical protein
LGYLVADGDLPVDAAADPDDGVHATAFLPDHRSLLRFPPTSIWFAFDDEVDLGAQLYEGPWRGEEARDDGDIAVVVFSCDVTDGQPGLFDGFLGGRGRHSDEVRNAPSVSGYGQLDAFAFDDLGARRWVRLYHDVRLALDAQLRAHGPMVAHVDAMVAFAASRPWSVTSGTTQV